MLRFGTKSFGTKFWYENALVYNCGAIWYLRPAANVNIKIPGAGTIQVRQKIFRFWYEIVWYEILVRNHLVRTFGTKMRWYLGPAQFGT